MDELDPADVRKLTELYDIVRGKFTYNGYYSIGKDMLVLIEPDLPSVFTDRSYTINIISVSKLLKENGAYVGKRQVNASEFELQLSALEESVGIRQLEVGEVETLKLLYSDQSTESTVGAEPSSTVSGSEKGSGDDK